MIEQHSPYGYYFFYTHGETAFALMQPAPGKKEFLTVTLDSTRPLLYPFRSIHKKINLSKGLQQGKLLKRSSIEYLQSTV